jgi:hypothetical protein
MRLLKNVDLWGMAGHGDQTTERRPTAAENEKEST